MNPNQYIALYVDIIKIGVIILVVIEIMESNKFKFKLLLNFHHRLKAILKFLHFNNWYRGFMKL